MYQPSVSFCIISNGLRPRILDEVIQSIERLDIPDKEVFVGGSPLLLPKGVIVVDAEQAAREGRLGEMRNRMISKATKDIIVVCDDDIIFEADFYTGICKYGPEFDFQCVRILNLDGSRYWDWPAIDEKGSQYLIPYNETSPHVYVTGGLCVFKRKFVGLVEWPTENGFYESEDVEFSKRIKAQNFSICMNAYSSVTHRDMRMTELMGRVVRLDMPYNWQLHSSACFLFGVNSITTKEMSATDKVMIDVPTHLYASPLYLSMKVSLREMATCFLHESQGIKIYNNNHVVGEYKLDVNSSVINFEIELPQSANATRLELVAEKQFANYWVVPSIHRSKQSYFIEDLQIRKKDGSLTSHNDIELKRYLSLHKGYDATEFDKGKKGLVFNWPLISANPYTVLMKSILKNIRNDFEDVGVCANSLEISFLAELKTREMCREVWEDMLGRIANPKINFNFLDYSMSFGFFEERVIKERARLTSMTSIVARNNHNINFHSGLFGISFNFQDKHIHLPFAVNRDCIYDVKRESRSKLKIGVEFDTKDVKSFVATIYALLESGLEDKEILIFEHTIQNELSEGIARTYFNVVCDAINIDKELRSQFVVLGNVFSLQERSRLYGTLDVLISCVHESDISNIMLPILNGVPIVCASKIKDDFIISQHYGVHFVLPRDDMNEYSKELAATLRNLSSCIEREQDFARLKSQDFYETYQSEKTYEFWRDFIYSLDRS